MKNNIHYITYSEALGYIDSIRLKFYIDIKRIKTKRTDNIILVNKDDLMQVLKEIHKETQKKMLKRAIKYF